MYKTDHHNPNPFHTLVHTSNSPQLLLYIIKYALLTSVETKESPLNLTRNTENCVLLKINSEWMKNFAVFQAILPY